MPPQPRGPRDNSLQPTSGTDSASPSPVPSFARTNSTWANLDVDTFGAGSSKSRSATTLEFEATEPEFNDGDGDEHQQQQISLYHELRLASEAPLKEQQYFNRNLRENLSNEQKNPLKHKSSGRAAPSNDYDDACCGHEHSDHLLHHHQQQQPVGKFRYVVASLIILSVTMIAYASNTMYIAAIEMISNDVLQSGLTLLRAKHISNDPLAVNKNAALPGTCPVEAVAKDTINLQPQLLTAATALVQTGFHQLSLANATAISAHEHWAMQQDSDALYADVNERLETGQLVDWSIQERGYVFTAHTLGTILLAVPISRLGLIYGSKAMILICLFLSGTRMALLPTIAGYSPVWATFLFELVIGGVGGNIFILGYPIAAAWLLPYEANFFVAINILSQMIGTAATNFISTQLLAVGLSWCWCYYIPGILLFLLSIGWFVWGSDRPESSRFVSRAELELLQSNTIAKRNASLLHDFDDEQNNNSDSASGQLFNSNKDDERQPLRGKQSELNNRLHQCHCPSHERDTCPASQLTRKPNWMVIFTCPTVWALILVQFANHWTTKNSTLWPTFFNNILHIDSSTIGIMLGIKGVWALIFGTLFAIATRTLVINRPFNISLTAYRRWNQVFATSICSVSVALMVIMDCDIVANFISLLIQPLVASFNSISHDQMPLDLSAEDSGLLVSVIRLLSIGDIVALPVSSYILSHAHDALAGDRATWQIVWLVGLAIRLAASFYFVLVAKSRPKSYSYLESQGACKTVIASKITVTTTTIITSDRYV